MEKESNKETWYLLVKERNKGEKRVETCIINQIHCYFY